MPKRSPACWGSADPSADGSAAFSCLGPGPLGKGVRRPFLSLTGMVGETSLFQSRGPQNRRFSPAFRDHMLPINNLYFQQHSRFQRVSTFIFIDIPASPWAAESRPFVFIDIPASLCLFLKLLVFLLSRPLRHLVVDCGTGPEPRQLEVPSNAEGSRQKAESRCSSF